MRQALNDTWAEFWSARTQREKTILMWGGLVAGIAIVYLVLWAPAYEGRARLRASLPTMQAQLAQMTAQANEARALSGAGQGATPTGGALRDALTQSLATNNMGAAQVQLIGTAVQIQLKNASFPLWTMWLDDVRKQLKVQVIETHVTAQQPDGQVDLTALLQPAQAQ
jgi:general secretion pathway protein M